MEGVSEMNDYINGLSKGVAMTDTECLRFYNGMIAALQDCGWHRITIDANRARTNIAYMQDKLAEQGMIAFVGEFGTPIIKALKND
jgi:hypothetical protein